MFAYKFLLGLIVRSLSPLYFLAAIAAIVSRYVPLLKTFSSHGKTADTSLKWWSIQLPKCYFWHFYIIGILWTATLFDLEKKQWYPSTLAGMLLFLHLKRRLYECLRVHRFHPESKMHLVGYLVGLGHYVALPFVFVARSKPVKLSTLEILVTALNLWMQYEQHIHHVILANMRKKKGGPLYVAPPSTRWFRWIFCPHYLAEILIYASWAVLLELQSTEGVPVGFAISDSKRADLLYVLEWMMLHRHWFLLLWVATNLGVSALNSLDWYREKFPNDKRNALIPRVL